MEKAKVMIGHAAGEITEKRSRFIANVYEIHSEAEALEILESVRKTYYDARHNCYAYVLGERNETQRFSDDKEPQGTAGKPILEVITRQGFYNTLIVVTRYFGGILLGTGGLLRAYTQAASEGLKQAEENGQAAFLLNGRELSITCDYSFSGKIQYLISQMEIPLADVIYETDVTYKVIVPTDQAEALIRNLTEVTNASARISISDPAFFRLSDGKPETYLF